MRNRTVMGIFERAKDAEKLTEELLEAGIARHRILVSRHAVSVVARSPLERQHIAALMARHGARQTSAPPPARSKP